MMSAQATILYSELENYTLKISATSPRGQVKSDAWTPCRSSIHLAVRRLTAKSLSREIGCKVSLWNVLCILVALLPRCLSNIRAIGKVSIQISQHRDFMGSYGKTSVRLVNIGPELKLKVDTTYFRFGHHYRHLVITVPAGDATPQVQHWLQNHTYFIHNICDQKLIVASWWRPRSWTTQVWVIVCCLPDQAIT